MIYLVTGPGRTGSTWLSQLIKEQVGAENDIHMIPTSPRDIDKQGWYHTVLHTHDHHWCKNTGINPGDVSLVISRRRDDFATQMSGYVARHTKECGEYSNKHITPFKVDLGEFRFLNEFRETWYDSLDLTVPYYNVSTIYFEDIVATSKVVRLTYEPLFKDTILDWPLLGKSPYSYKDWISNWKELYEAYLQITKS